MIGLNLTHANVTFIREFFQLFKTPWELCKSGERYDVIISDDPEAVFIDSKLVVILIGQFNRDRSELIETCSGVLLQSETGVFPVYCGCVCIEEGQAIITRRNDKKIVGARWKEGLKTIIRIGFNFFEETQYLLGKGQPLESAEYPTLEMHIDNLRNWILEAGVTLVEIPPVPSGSRFFACLTHDVDNAGIRNNGLDHTLAGFVYRALIVSVFRWLKGGFSVKMVVRNWGALAALPLVKLGLAKDFWITFRKYTQIEKEAKSTFFFVPFKDMPGKLTDDRLAPSFRAVKYKLSGLQNEIDHVLKHGCEVAVHGIDSWADVSKGKEEIRTIAGMASCSRLGVRMHWLYFEPQSPRRLEQAGFDYDSTCGFNEKVGYKAGTLQVFKPADTEKLLEIPLHIMDTALFYPDRMNLTLPEGIKAIKGFARQAANFGGVLTLNWHDRSIAPERLWGGVYQDALNELKSQGARFSTARNVVQWFRNRRGIAFDGVACNRFSVRIALAGEYVKHSEDLLVRVYSGNASLPIHKTKSPLIRQYKDIPVAGRTMIEVPF